MQLTNDSSAVVAVCLVFATVCDSEKLRLQNCKNCICSNIYTTKTGYTLVPYEIPLIAENTCSLPHKVFRHGIPVGKFGRPKMD